MPNKKAGKAKRKANQSSEPKHVLEKPVTVPGIIDVTINLPGDRRTIEIRFVSTDTISDLRHALEEHVAFCHATSYSLEHSVRGVLYESQELSLLKPATVSVKEKDYNEVTAKGNVRRLIDIVACTEHFGHSTLAEEEVSVPNTKPDYDVNVLDMDFQAKAKAEEESEFGLWQPPQLGDFYTFFSIKSQQGPMLRVSWADKQPNVQRKEKGGDFFFINVDVLKPQDGNNETTSPPPESFAITACTLGFYVSGKPSTRQHTLVQLLRRESFTFRERWAELLEAFAARNPWGNIPAGLRSNTWLMPPTTAGEENNSSYTFVPLPAEDPLWGGDNGGHVVDDHKRNWRSDFQTCAEMQGNTAKERVLRDRRLFLVNQAFTDAAAVRGTRLIDTLITQRSNGKSGGGGEENNITRVEERQDHMVVEASTLSSSRLSPCSVREEHSELSEAELLSLSESALLCGLASDGNTASKQVDTLATVKVHFRGYVAKICAEEVKDGTSHIPLMDEEEEPYANPEGLSALNISSLRRLLRYDDEKPGIKEEVSSSSSKAEPTTTSNAEYKNQKEEEGSERNRRALDIIRHVLEQCEATLEEGEASDPVLRWELGANLAAHMADPFKHRIDGQQPSVGGGNIPLPLPSATAPLPPRKGGNRRNPKTMFVPGSKGEEDYLLSCLHPDVCALLSLEEQRRLVVSGNGIFRKKSTAALMRMAAYYVEEVALPRVVADFGSLELSPVDGSTLTEFLHSRGLNMRCLGKVAEMAQIQKYCHVTTLATQEMVARAMKRLLRAVISTSPLDLVRDVIAITLSLCLGRLAPNDTLQPLADKLWGWIERFVEQRFKYKVAMEKPEEEEKTEENQSDGRRRMRDEIKPIALLRNLCQKLGIAIVTRNYDFSPAGSAWSGGSDDAMGKEDGGEERSSLFHIIRFQDIVSLEPVIKHANYTSSDGKALLEESKMYLDRGLLDEALESGTLALVTMQHVCCGPPASSNSTINRRTAHRQSSAALSLLAVVLYHTGDFAQATIYQQRALANNERELGLDHPDTMKSYGDLAVFYYRLTHTSLAMTYVRRALYLLHIASGPLHPNAAATLINVAMMEEGLGNVTIALRSLQEALRVNVKLLGVEHVQTAASYHAIAIALSLMEPPAYSLSVTHEGTTLEILERLLGVDDMRTQDAAAWLEYFENKAAEQSDAWKKGKSAPDTSIASKGHLPLDDLMRFINEEEEAAAAAMQIAAEARMEPPKVVLKGGARRKRSAKNQHSKSNGSSISSSSASASEESDANNAHESSEGEEGGNTPRTNATSSEEEGVNTPRTNAASSEEEEEEEEEGRGSVEDGNGAVSSEESVVERRDSLREADEGEGDGGWQEYMTAKKKKTASRLGVTKTEHHKGDSSTRQRKRSARRASAARNGGTSGVAATGGENSALSSRQERRRGGAAKREEESGVSETKKSPPVWGGLKEVGNTMNTKETLTQTSDHSNGNGHGAPTRLSDGSKPVRQDNGGGSPPQQGGTLKESGAGKQQEETSRARPSRLLPAKVANPAQADSFLLHSSLNATAKEFSPARKSSSSSPSVLNATAPEFLPRRRSISEGSENDENGSAHGQRLMAGWVPVPAAHILSASGLACMSNNNSSASNLSRPVSPSESDSSGDAVDGFVVVKKERNSRRARFRRSRNGKMAREGMDNGENGYIKAYAGVQVSAR